MNYDEMASQVMAEIDRTGFSMIHVLKLLEQKVMCSMLNKHNGNVSYTADALKMKRSTLHMRLSKTRRLHG